MRNLIFNILVLGAALLYGGAVSGAAPKNYAIVVGIGDYPEESGWSRIHGDRDVSLVVDMLERNGFLKENIICLENDGATKTAIENAFYSLQSSLGQGDRVYVHFSGHGQQVTDLDGDEEDGKDEAFIPYDACSKYVQGKYEGEKHIVDDELNAWLSDMADAVGKKGLVMVVIDACHSGDATRGIGNGTEEVVVRGTADLFEIPADVSENRAESSGNMQRGKPAKLKRKISWICLSACKSYQNNNEYRSDDGYYGRLSWAMNEVLMPGMNLDELISGIKSEFSVLPLPQGPPQTPDFVYPRDRSFVRVF